MLKLQSPIYLLQEPGHPQAEACRRCDVRSGALFGALDDAALVRIHAHIAGPELDAGDPIYTRGQQREVVYTIRSGIVRFERSTAAGDRRIVRLAGRGDLIGLEALLGQPHADDAVACTPVALCRIPTALVDTLGQGHGAMHLELMRRWQQALDGAETWSVELTTGPVRQRLLHLIQRLQALAEQPGTIWLPRRDDIGDMLDITEETASRQISRLRREGVLAPLPGQLAQLDALALRRAIDEAAHDKA